MEIYNTCTRQMLNHIAQTDYFHDKPVNLLFKFNNNAYELVEDYTNIKILIDSGAYYFNALNQTQGEKRTFEFIAKYMDFIKNTLDDERIMGYFDMDLRYMGLDKIEKIRDKLFNITDKIIPVYHLSWGEYEFKRMCRNYKYIGFPCSTAYTAKQFMPFVKYAHKMGCKIHGLGMDRHVVMKHVPFNSTDSATWNRRAIVQGYYFNHNIPKTTENNLKYSPYYLERELLNQYRRQEYYQKLWKSYHDKQNYK